MTLITNIFSAMTIPYTQPTSRAFKEEKFPYRVWYLRYYLLVFFYFFPVFHLLFYSKTGSISFAMLTQSFNPPPVSGMTARLPAKLTDLRGKTLILIYDFLYSRWSVFQIDTQIPELFLHLNSIILGEDDSEFCVELF